MARFEHDRYPAIEFQRDGDARPWATFAPEERSFGEHTIRVGVLETDDDAVIRRMRDAIERGGDPHLKEVSSDGAPGDDLDELEKDDLLKVANDEEVEVDKRWGVDRIRAAIRDGRK